MNVGQSVARRFSPAVVVVAIGCYCYAADVAAQTQSVDAVDAGSEAADVPSPEASTRAAPPSESTAAPVDQHEDDLADLSLDELLQITITTASGTEQTLEEAPSIVEVITSQEIRDRGYRTVAEALSHLPGLTIIDDHVSYNVGIRGLFSNVDAANETIKVMINGQPTSFRPTATNFLGYDLIPINAVDRIEVVRSPASALYGANAFLGVVNVITREGSGAADHRDNQVRLDSYLMQNSSDTTLNGSLALLSGGDVGRLSYFVAAAAHHADRSGLVVPGITSMAQDARSHGGAAADDYYSPAWDLQSREHLLGNATSKGDIENTGSAYGKTTLKLSDNAELRVDGHFQYSDHHAEFQEAAYLTHDTRLTYMNGFLRALLSYGEHKEAGLSSVLSVALSTGRPTDADRIVDPLLAGSYKRRNFGYKAIDLAAEGRYTFSTNNSFALGVDFSNDFQDLLALEVVNAKTKETTTEFDLGSESFANIGAYGQLTWNPWGKLILTLGARADHNSVVACNGDRWDCLGHVDDTPEGDSTAVEGGLVQLSTRAAAVYTFPVAGLYAKIIYGSSFKPPSPYELYHDQLTITMSSVGNDRLRPQNANTFEAMIGANPASGLRLSLIGFYVQVDDMVLVLKEEQMLGGRNANVRLGGAEGAVSLSWGSVIAAFANVSYMALNEVCPLRNADETDYAWRFSPYNTVIDGGQYPDLLINAGLNVQPTNSHINANLTVRYVGARRASFVNTQLYSWLDLNNSYTLPPYVDVGVTVSSVGLNLFPFFGEDGETVVSASVRGVPGNYVEPGVGGLDIPSLGPRFYMEMEQQF